MSSNHPQTRVTVLISGSGTNLQALINAQGQKNLSDSKIVRVISNRKDAYGLKRAEIAQIPSAYHNLKKFKDKYPDDIPRARREYDIKLAEIVLEDEPHLVVCAGWMHILSAVFLEKLREKGVDIINLHPALPGQFNGTKAIERAHQAFMNGEITETGVMIHYVIHEVDMGEPIVIKKVPLNHPADDDIDALEERIHGIEHEAIVEGTNLAICNFWDKRHE
jgi:phosphoribosylglycinamide formyltransferase